MKASLQKRTDLAKCTTLKVKSQHASLKGRVSIIGTVTGRFAGMSEDLERIKPVRIPGYKVRG